MLTNDSLAVIDDGLLLFFTASKPAGGLLHARAAELLRVWENALAVLKEPRHGLAIAQVKIEWRRITGYSQYKLAVCRNQGCGNGRRRVGGGFDQTQGRWFSSQVATTKLGS